MQEAIPFRNYFPGGTNASINVGRGGSFGKLITLTNDGESYVRELVKENSIVVFARQGCCMCHVLKRLLLGLGVNPPVYEVDEVEEGRIIKELARINAGETGSDEGDELIRSGCFQFPVVFLGGKLFGGLDRVMATHLSGELVPILKDAGALWL